MNTYTQDVFKENNNFQKFPKRKPYESDKPERKGKKGSYSVLRGLKRLEE